MKKFLIVVLTLLVAGQFSLAQEPRRMMTMEEAVLGTGLRSPVPMTRWTGDKQVIALVDGPRGMMPPRGARNRFAYTRGNNLYYTDKAGVEHA
ncbi:MAG: hypothetical protein J6U31_06280, partial [Bacteroidales bacterium]|nr:hypothetical protein [Bacteroidales bacterium]